MAARESTIIIVSGEAILSGEKVENLWVVGAPPRTPLGELTALPDPLAGGEGVAAPPHEPHSRSLFEFSCPNEKSWHGLDPITVIK